MPFTSKTAAQAGKRSSRKNVPNKSTEEIREAYQLLVEKNLTKMSRWLNKVAKEDPAKALELIHKFSDFLLPKLNRTEISKEITPEKYDTREERDEFIKKMEEKIQQDAGSNRLLKKA